MVKLAAVLTVLVLAMAEVASADEVADDGAAGALDEAMRKDPDRFHEMAVDLIAGFGGPTGLTLDGLEEHIALERAAARASELRRFLAMDLNADGTVDRAELAISQRAASASARGRLEREFATSDGNGDGEVDPAEQRAEGFAAALRRLGEGEAGMLRALMALDANGDGALRIDEVQVALARLDEAT